MEKSLLIIKSLQKIKLKNSKCFFSIYLFGSFSSANEANDIDILILYDSNNVELKKVFLLRDNIKELLQAEYGKIIDILLLTYKEEQEIDFINNEGCYKLIDM